MNIGIVGSSFSVGCHHNPKTGENNLAAPFESWLVKYLPEYSYYNSACSGKGTELYLDKIVYLKEKHDVDFILMELVNNRSMLNVKSQDYDLTNVSSDVYKDSASIWEHVRGITQPINYDTFGSKREFDIWKRVQEQIAYNENAFEFWGILDCQQAIKLCKMLNIGVITWQKSFDFREHIDTDVKFDEYPNAHEYYISRYSEEEILCDHVHFNDTINEEMIRDFIVPAIKSKINA